ncbi:MAG: hypothetical protein ACOC5E_02105, partial [Acidobacteriota bacterium]
VRETLPALDHPRDPETYLWDSFDGCSRCQALSGLYAGSRPARPHPMCRCDIVRLDEAPDWRQIVHCFRVEIDDVRADVDAGRAPGATFSLVCRYRGECVDGGEHDGEVQLEQSWDAWHDFDADETTFTRGYDLALLAAFERIGEELEATCDCDLAPAS